MEGAKVLIIQKSLPHYRLTFFEGLRRFLLTKGVELSLAYGNGNKEDQKKQDLVKLDWAIPYENEVFSVAGKELYWQPLLHLVADFDLVVVEQANKLLLNYMLMVRKKKNGFKLAFWGHGIAENIGVSKTSKLWKQRLFHQADWWFAYTRGVADLLSRFGIDPSIITVVQNAIDTKKLQADFEAGSQVELDLIKETYNIKGNRLGIYCGGIYEEKRSAFLLDAVIAVREQIADFEFIVVGAGCEDFYWKNAALAYPFIHYLGPQFGAQKAALLKLSDVFLCPGLVGLAVLDAFVTQCPLITTDYRYHSPEVDYLEHGYNGLITDNTLDDYVQEVVALLEDEQRLNEMKTACAISAAKYSIEHMVDNFGKGILSALQPTLNTVS